MDDLDRAERSMAKIVELIESSRHNEALALIEEVEPVFSAAERPDRLLAAQQRRYMVYALIDRLDEAIAGNRELVVTYEACGDGVSAAKVRTNLGFNLNEAGDRAGAAAQFRLAARMFRQYPGREYELATAYMNLGIVLMATRTRASYAYVQAAAKLFERAGRPVKTADCLLLLARHSDKRGERDAADQLRDQAQREYLRAGDPVRASHVDYLRGSAAGRRGSYVEAARLLEVALRSFLTMGAPTQLELADCSRRVALAHRALSNPRLAWPFALLAVLAMNEVRTGLRDARLRATWRERRGPIYALALRLALDLDERQASIVLIEATRAQQAPVTSLLPQATIEGIADITDRGPVHELSAQDDGAAMATSELPASSEQALSLAGLIESEPLPGFAIEGIEPLRMEAQLATIAERLELDRSMVTFPPLEPHSVVDLIDVVTRWAGPSGVWWSTVVVDDELFWAAWSAGACEAGSTSVKAGSPARQAISELTTGLPDGSKPLASRRALLDGWSHGRQFDLHLRQLEGIVPGLVRDAVVANACDGSSAVVLHAPATELASLPLQLMPVGHGDLRILDGAAIAYCPSPALTGTQLHERDQPTPPGAPLLPLVCAVVDPLGDLPSVRSLARDAESAVGTSAVRWGKAALKPASRANLSAALDGNAASSDGVFVFAGHSTSGSANDPLDAAVILSDGSLTAREMLTPAGRERFPLPRRVMFASCSSAGLGHNDWAGLTTASSVLGAEIALASLWPLASGSAANRIDRAALRAFRSADPLKELHLLQQSMLRRWRRKSTHMLGKQGRAARDPRLWMAYVTVLL